MIPANASPFVRVLSVYVSRSGFSPAASTEPSGATVNVVPPRAPARKGVRTDQSGALARRSRSQAAWAAASPGVAASRRALRRAISASSASRFTACSGVGTSRSGSMIHLSTTVGPSPCTW